MNSSQILGAAIMVIGVVVLGFAFNATNAPVEQITETMTGRYTDQTTLYFVLGVAALVVGGLMFAAMRRR